MLQIIQILTIAQGLFLMVILLKTRSRYYKPAFWLLMGCVASVILYLLGDDDNNPFFERVDVFFFDKSLFITFLFLFIKYQHNKAKQFFKQDYLYFIPNVLFFIIEILETVYSEGILAFDIPELILEFVFLSYLVFSLIIVVKQKSNKWMLFFILPLILLIAHALSNEILYGFRFDEIILSKHEHFGSYTIVIIALLFYSIAFKLVLSPNDILPSSDTKKYKNSNLNPQLVKQYKQALLKLMEEDQAYTDANLSIQSVSDTLDIPKPYISEVLNIYMETNFQDFINSYRVNAFIACLQKEQYDHYSLVGIANEVGFKSKSTFYTTFKKFKGLTPLEYKKQQLSS